MRTGLCGILCVALLAACGGSPPTGGGIVAAVLSSGAPAPARAQHEHEDSPLGVPLARTGSGTAWLPDAARMPGYHESLGRWTLMVHGSVFLQYDRQFGTRAADQLGSVNWVMLMAARPAAGGMLRLRTMVSAEPWTLTPRGYPELLQVAEPYRGGTLTDRQHPHELISELSVDFDHPLGSRVGASLSAAPVGEPALGPVADLHRPSAEHVRDAQLGHPT